MLSIEQLVEKAALDGASDIHLIRALPPKYRLDGQLQDMAEEPLTEEDCFSYARELAGGHPLGQRPEAAGAGGAFRFIKRRDRAAAEAQESAAALFDASLPERRSVGRLPPRFHFL